MAVSLRSFLRVLRDTFSPRRWGKKRAPLGEGRRTSRNRPRVEYLEDRLAPAGFVPGSIQGQDGWSGGTVPISASVDQTVDQSGAPPAHTGVGSWRVSNNTASGNFNGAFAGWPFSPGLSVTAGQPSSGAGADQFNATFFFRSASTVADGSNIEVDLGSSAGDDRNNFLAITNRADADGGLQVRIDEPDGATGNFFPTQIAAPNITRGTYHRIDIQAKFINGQANDTFQVSLDGNLIINLTPNSPNNGTSNWGTFEGFRDFSGTPYVQSNRLFWRSGAAPSAFGAAFSDTAAQGFYFDDVSYRVSKQSAPNTALASYAATFEPEAISFAISASNGQVYRHRVNAPWATFAPGIFIDLAVTEYGPMRAPVVFGLGSDHIIYKATFTPLGDLITGWVAFAPGLFTSLDATTYGNGNPIVFGLGGTPGGNRIYFATFDQNAAFVSGFGAVAPGVFSAVVAGNFGPGNPAVFGLGRDDHRAYIATYDSSGTFVKGWSLVAPGVFSGLAAVNRPNGTIELFGTGITDHALFGANISNTGTLANGFFPIVGNPAGPNAFGLLTAAALPDNSNNVRAFALLFDPADQRPFTAMLSPAGTLTSASVGTEPFTFLSAGSQSGFVQLYGIKATDKQIYLELFDETGALLQPFQLTAPGMFIKVKATP